MFRYKTNKQAFIIAALIILLCLVCLTGATLALFTSDTNDGAIGIITTSGDIEVDIVDTAGESLMGKFLSFVSFSGNTDILFEPGATFATQGFKIKNTGEIPVHFRLSIAKDNVVDINNRKVDIAEIDEAFEIWIVEQKPNGELDYSAAMELNKFQKNLPVGQNSASTYHLVVKMKETADNTFKGKTYMGIGVTICAVQSNAKVD
jgi:hypothetical protein